MIISKGLIALEWYSRTLSSYKKEKVLNVIWQQARLKLDHDVFMVHREAPSQLSQKPLKMDQKYSLS